MVAVDEAQALTYVGERLQPVVPGRRGLSSRLAWVPTAQFSDQAQAARWLTEGQPGDRQVIIRAHRLGLPEHLRTGGPRRFRLRRKVTVTDTLYTRLGEQQGLRAVVDVFYTRVLADTEITAYFERLSEDGRAQLRWHMVAFLAKATGGPDNYAGRDLTTAHAHLGITPEAFDRVAGHLVSTLRMFEVAPEDVSAVEAAVVGLKVQVVSA